MRNKFLTGIVLASFIAVLVLSVINPLAGPAYAVSPTPQSFNAAVRDSEAFTFFSARSITADTRECLDMRNFSAADISYVIDEGTVNTITLKLQFTNDGVHFYDSAQTVVSAAVADGDGFQRYLLFGQKACIFADVANTNPVIVTAIAQGK